MISFLYSTVGFVLILGYAPQIIQLIRTQTDCRDVSVSAWMVWNYTSVVSLLYSLFEIGDTKLILVNGMNVICINFLIALILYKRMAYRKREADKKTPL